MEMNYIAVLTLITVIKGIDAARKINGKQFTGGASSKFVIKSAIPYSTGGIEVTVWTQQGAKHISILALLKKGEGAQAEYRYEPDAFHVVEDGNLFDKTGMAKSFAALKEAVLAKINGAIAGRIQLEADSSSSGLSGVTNADLKKVGQKLIADKKYEVDGKNWDVVAVTGISSLNAPGGKLMFVAKRQDGEKHYSELVTAVKPDTKIGILDLYQATNGKVADVPMDAQAHVIAEALTAMAK